MADADPVAREVDCRVVYCGAEGAGKTANLEYLHEVLDPDTRGKLITPGRRGDGGYFFDFLTVDLGVVRRWRARVHLYAIAATTGTREQRGRILRGADGLIVVVDSDPDRQDANREALATLQADLESLELAADALVASLQYNKRDLPDAVAVERLEEGLNPGGVPYHEAVARRGDGVVETLEEVGFRVIRSLDLPGEDV